MTVKEIANIIPDTLIWDDFDEAIICLCKRDKSGKITYYNNDGEITLELEENNIEEENEETNIDYWGRETFNVVLYDTDKVIQTLIDKDGMEEEEAIEYFHYNIEGGYIGPNTPIAIRLKTNE